MTETNTGSLLQRALADIVTADSRTASVFDRVGLDYCCHGHQTLEDAAGERGLQAAAVLAEIEALGPAGAREEADAAWTDLAALTRHIVTSHHQYVRGMSPTIQQWLARLVARHGERHRELAEVAATFDWLASDMATHMVKEENILFPYVDALADASRSGSRLPASPFGTILNPIRVMEEDHRQAGDQLLRLRQLTHDFTPPEDACTTFRVCYEELARYEADLHRHVHLENNVLFPRAVALEEQLS